MPKIHSIRQTAHKQQNGRCFYCGFPMLAASEIGSSRILKRFLCTAEHVIARSEGGSSAPTNIVAACYFCNQTRHRARNPKSHQDYKLYVANRLTQGKWHPKRAVTALKLLP